MNGREMGSSDRNEFTRLATGIHAKKRDFRDLIHEVVQSEIFHSK